MVNRKKKSPPRRKKTEPGLERHADRFPEEMMAMMAEAHSMSFANMLRFQPSLRARLKLPPWLQFLLPYARRDQATLTPVEQQRFLCAFNVVNSNGTVGTLCDIHADPSHMMHHTLRFLPWHRVFLLQFEQALRAIVAMGFTYV
jgi:hypothetical protein